MMNWRRSSSPDEAVGCAVDSGASYAKLCPGGALSAANVAAMAALALGSSADRKAVLLALSNCSETIDGWVVAGAAIESNDPARLDDLLSVMELDMANPRYVQIATITGKSKSLKWLLDHGAAVEDVDGVPIFAQAIAWMKEGPWTWRKEGPNLSDRKEAFIALCAPEQLARLSASGKLCAIDALGSALGGEAFSNKYNMGSAMASASSGFKWLWENLKAEELAQSRAAVGAAFKWAVGRLTTVEILSNYRTEAENASWAQEVAEVASTYHNDYGEHGDPDQLDSVFESQAVKPSKPMNPMSMKGWSLSFVDAPHPQTQPPLRLSTMSWARAIDWPVWEARCREMGWTLGAVVLSEALEMSRSGPEGASKMDDWFDRCESLLKCPVWDCPEIFSMGPISDLSLSSPSSPAKVIFNRLVRGWHELPRKAIRDRLAYLGQLGSQSTGLKDTDDALTLIKNELMVLAAGCRSDVALCEWFKSTAEKCMDFLGGHRDFDPFSSSNGVSEDHQSIFESLALAAEGVSDEPLKATNPGRMRL